ncbi:Major facilitator superfamily domain-containing protein 1 [Araneus ventricosus]|uniref:Lysosomal dipeptide transporter MFSD1 n=1 Tax=Araneus ventricosus TaxID=182803 RepID=A0A4Y2EYC8_ARAVE|nr:Major facilitator superfamily domain-containing protein 1 [Araneus ventricosus]
MCCQDVERPSYRFTVLFFNCLLTFGSYYCFDMPSVMQDKMEKDYHCNNNTQNSSCCSDCLGMSPNDYNLLYAVYSWTNAFVVIGAGFLIDKYGNQVGALFFSSLCVIGSCIFALGTHYRGTDYMIPLMLFGRLVFGAGNGSLTIVQNRITSFWFAGKELALAFGVTLAFSRLGSVLNFFFTGHLTDAIGIKYTLWIGAGLCGLGFISAIIVGLLDVHGFKKLGMFDAINTQSKLVRVSDVKYFSLSYWLLILSIMFFYNGVFPFVADASKFISVKYHYDDNVSAYMAGAVYDVSLVLSPFLGGLIACMWPSIPLVVSQATIGTAMGIATSLQMIGIGFSNLIVGEILSDKSLISWKYVMIYLLGNVTACIITSVFLNIDDYRKDGILNISRKEAKERDDSTAIGNRDTEALVESLQPIND